MQRSASWIIPAAAVLAFAATPLLAANRQTVAKAREGNTAYAAGDFAKAQEAYRAAEVDCPECPELAYNLGLTYYRQRDFEQARQMFNQALTTRDLGLEARAKFNLGNVAYSQALEKISNLPEAITHARQAIDYYRGALDLNDRDDDARVNIETAQLLIKDLLDKQKQQQEQQKQQDQQQQNQQNCQNQNQDQKQGDQQDQKDQQKQDQQQDQSEQQKQDGQKQQDQQQQQQEQQQEQKAQSADDRQEQEAKAGERRELTREEAERLLQAVRDKEAKRRDDLARRRSAKRPPVTRDW